MSFSKLRVYVAGGWSFREQLKDTMHLLKTAHERIEIVSGWIERENGINTPAALADDAREDVKEVSSADVIVAVMDDAQYAYRGTFTEIGCALGQGKKIFIVCPGTAERDPNNANRYHYSHNCQSNVFFHHPSIQIVSSVDQVFGKLKALATEMKD